MIRTGLLKVLLLIFTFALFGLPPQHGFAAKRTDFTDLCLGCHPKALDLANSKVVHKPVSKGACTACHNPHVSKHAGLLSDTGKELCYQCHKEQDGFTGKVVHSPLKQGRCLQCHDPHSSNSAGLLRQSLSETCFKCHNKDDIFSKKNIHPEVKKLKCATCHAAHSSDIPGLLVKEKIKLCGDCHYNGESKPPIPCRYEVRGSDCTSCHSPHSSDRAGLLKASLHKPFEDDKCSTCHSKKSEWDIKGDYSLCIKCHENTMESFNKINSHMATGFNGKFWAA